MPEHHADNILAVLRKQEAAIAQGDAQGAVAPLAPEVVIYDLPPPLEYRGDKAQREIGLQKWFATWEGNVSTELSKPKVIINGDLAVVFGLSRMRGRKQDAGDIDAWNRRTVVLQRSDLEGWRIIHDHSSYPMKMDGSQQAALDLKPNADL